MFRLLKNILEQDPSYDLQRIQSIIDLMPILVVCKDIHNGLRIRLWNKASARLWQKEMDQVLGKQDSEIWPSKVASALREKDLFAISMNTPDEAGKEETFTLDNGEIIWLKTWRIPIRNSTNDADFLMTISQDITASKRLEQELRKRRKMLRSISLNAPGMFYQFKMEPNGHFSFPLVSHKASKILGISPREIMKDAMAVHNRVHPEDTEHLLTSIHESAKTLSTWRWEGRLLKDDNTGVTWVSFASDPHQDEDGSIIWDGIATDITAKKEAESRARDQEAKLLAASRLVCLGEMAGAIAHEMNTPLSCILMGSEQISECLNESNPNYAAVAQFSELIKNTTERMAKIVMGLRTLARSAEGDAMNPASIGALVDQTVSFCKQKFQGHRIRLVYHTIETASFVDCKEVEIAQVLVNLLNNAFDAVVGTENAWVRISSTETDEHIQIRIADSGSGIPVEIRSRIFEPFFSTKEPGKGTGLGLCISHRIIERHGGKLLLDAESASTTFVLELPKSKLRLAV